MRNLTAIILLGGVAGVLANPAAAQNAPAKPAVPVLPVPQPDANDVPTLPRPSATPGWTFEEVLGGEVTVGEPVSPTALAVGALTGVVAFNVLQQYVFPNGSLLSQTFLAESDIAASRIYAIGSAALGALAGQYVYEQTNDDRP